MKYYNSYFCFLKRKNTFSCEIYVILNLENLRGTNVQKEIVCLIFFFFFSFLFKSMNNTEWEHVKLFSIYPVQGMA